MRWRMVCAHACATPCAKSCPGRVRFLGGVVVQGINTSSLPWIIGISPRIFAINIVIIAAFWGNLFWPRGNMLLHYSLCHDFEKGVHWKGDRVQTIFFSKRKKTSALKAIQNNGIQITYAFIWPLLGELCLTKLLQLVSLLLYHVLLLKMPIRMK